MRTKKEARFSYDLFEGLKLECFYRFDEGGYLEECEIYYMSKEKKGEETFIYPDLSDLYIKEGDRFILLEDYLEQIAIDSAF